MRLGEQAYTLALGTSQPGLGLSVRHTQIMRTSRAKAT